MRQRCFCHLVKCKVSSAADDLEAPFRHRDMKFPGMAISSHRNESSDVLDPVPTDSP
jgi:hypothetical protein